MQKLDSDNKLALSLFFGLIFGGAISNLALGLCLGLLVGSTFKLKDKK